MTRPVAEPDTGLRASGRDGQSSGAGHAREGIAEQGVVARGVVGCAAIDLHGPDFVSEVPGVGFLRPLTIVSPAAPPCAQRRTGRP